MATTTLSSMKSPRCESSSPIGVSSEIGSAQFQDFATGHWNVHAPNNLFASRLAAQLLHQLAAGTRFVNRFDLCTGIRMVRLVRDGTGNRLTNPPRGIRRSFNRGAIRAITAIKPMLPSESNQNCNPRLVYYLASKPQAKVSFDHSFFACSASASPQ
jgi:hypothetical protein